MSKFQSKCGYVMVMQTGHENYEYILLNSKDWLSAYISFADSQPKVIKRLDSDDDIFHKIQSLLLGISVPALKCPNCGRIYIDLDNNNNWTIFKPENWED